MFHGFTEARVSAMTRQERRWLNNIKKAIYDSDLDYSKGCPEERAMDSLCTAIDTASLLRRSLNDDELMEKRNKFRFIEFVDLEVPSPANGGLDVTLINARDAKPVACSFSSLVYAIRCMYAHENENLNAAEEPEYHIQLDWTMRSNDHAGILRDGRFILNAHFLWNRLRELLSKFVTGTEAFVALAEGRDFSISSNTPLLSIRPN